MVFLECFKRVLLHETRNSSCEEESRRFFGWITIAERKLGRGQNRKQKGMEVAEGGRGEAYSPRPGQASSECELLGKQEKKG